MDRQSFRRNITVDGQSVAIYDIRRLERDGLADIERLPFSIRILTENLLRRLDHKVVRKENVLNIARWRTSYDSPVEIPFHPARVLMQDFTGVPAVVDLASMREAISRLGGSPEAVNPVTPVELVVDHSVQVDFFGCQKAAELNVKREYHRNGERYSLLKWATHTLDNFRVAPPGAGICHQVNLESLGRMVMTGEEEDQTVAYPDTLVGLDSHTTMINALGVLGWGVGGVEAEAVMLGQPYYMAIPQVIGVRLTGELPLEATSTDLVLTVTETLRKYNVVGKFVEFFGPGVKNLSVPDRATISNMTPEFGATATMFPVDDRTIEYMRDTDRASRANLAEAYFREAGLLHAEDQEPTYTDLIEFDLSKVERSVSGPARPQDRIPIRELKRRTRAADPAEGDRGAVEIEVNNHPTRISNQSVVIAAITSCTNTSNPSLLIGAGLLAKKAVELGLKVPPHVKTSFAPGSTVVPRYLKDAGLMPYLEALGFHVVGYGCTTCIGNSGPLHPAVEAAIVENDLDVAAVLSGNRNFEARIHQRIRSNYLASPMLVVAYALAGRVDIDLTADPVGLDPNGTPVHLEELWPSKTEVNELIERYLAPEFFESEYAHLYDGDDNWRSLEAGESLVFNWDPQSSYIRNPPYFDDFSLTPEAPRDFSGGRALVFLGDSVTTDHISPAGAIPKDYPAGRYLVDQGVQVEDFNSYGSRRGNHEVMIRGSFGNVRLSNKLADGKQGSYTKKLPEGRLEYIYDAAMEYAEEGTPLLVIGGEQYGAGSSRDWAAKGTRLLGVRTVIASSYERIHRSNLVCLGVLPLQFLPGENAQSLGLDGTEIYATHGIEDISPAKEITVRAERSDGSEMEFKCVARLDTDVEVEYFLHGGILRFVLRKMAPESKLNPTA